MVSAALACSSYSGVCRGVCAMSVTYVLFIVKLPRVTDLQCGGACYDMPTGNPTILAGVTKRLRFGGLVDFAGWLTEVASQRAHTCLANQDPLYLILPLRTAACQHSFTLFSSG